MLAVTLTLAGLMSFAFLIIGTLVGWVARGFAQERITNFYPMHPEFLDQNGNIIPDEIMSVRFENPEDFMDEP
jgi:hypothetical protein